MNSPWDTLMRHLHGTREIVLCAPYVKADVLQRILDLLSPNSAVTCITRWLPRDILAGVSDLECRALILDHGGQFHLHPRLHAKYYRCDDQVLIGSANLTARGLHLTGQSNLEVLCAPAPDFDSAAFERTLWQEARELSDKEWTQWATLGSLLQFAPPLIQDWNNSDIRDWRPSTRDPEHVWLLYSNQGSQIVSPDEEHLARKDIEALAVPQGLARAQFDTWMRAQLLASSFVISVICLEGTGEDRQIWIQLANQWGLKEHEAARDLETTRNWRAIFHTD